MTQETIGSRIREQRTKLGLSQQAIASAAGVSQGLIGQIEAGINKGSKHVIAIARALGVPPDWLEDGVGQPSTVEPLIRTAEDRWLLALWQAAGAEAKEVARFVLSKRDDPMPPWANQDIRDQLDSMKYKALEWLRDAPDTAQKNRAA